MLPSMSWATWLCSSAAVAICWLRPSSSSTRGDGCAPAPGPRCRPLDEVALGMAGATAHGGNRTLAPSCNCSINPWISWVDCWVRLASGTHFVRHHGEAAPGLPGPRCLDGGIERQQVGLLGDAADHRKAPGRHCRHAGAGCSAPGGLFQFLRQRTGLAAGVNSTRRRPSWARAAASRVECRMVGVAGDLGHGGAHLVHRGGHLVQGPGAGAPPGPRRRRLLQGLGHVLVGLAALLRLTFASKPLTSWRIRLASDDAADLVVRMAPPPGHG